MYRVIADFRRIQPGTLAFANFRGNRDNRWRRPPARALSALHGDGRNNAAVADRTAARVNNGVRESRSSAKSPIFYATPVPALSAVSS